MQRVQSNTDSPRFVGRPRVDEGSLRFFRDRFEQCRVVVCHDDVPVLVALLRHDAILDDRNRGAFRGTETDRDNGEAHLARASGLRQNLVWTIEPFSIAHEDDRFVALRLAE